MGVESMHLSKKAGRQISQSWRHLGRRCEITILNYLCFFLKVALKLFNGLHFNYIKSKPGAGARDAIFKNMKISRRFVYLHLFNICSFQKVCGPLSDTNCKTSSCISMWQQRHGTRNLKFLELYYELYQLLEQFLSSLSTLNAEIVFKWELQHLCLLVKHILSLLVSCS